MVITEKLAQWPPTFCYVAIISMFRNNFLQSFKKIATLNCSMIVASDQCVEVMGLIPVTGDSDVFFVLLEKDKHFIFCISFTERKVFATFLSFLPHGD